MATRNNRFNDIFHDYGDDEDGQDDDYVDFDNLFQNMVHDDELKFVHDDAAEHDTINPLMEEERLSQKLSQLSASGNQEQQQEQYSNEPEEWTTVTKKRPSLTPTTPVVTMKKFKSSNDDLPDYLSTTNQNFQELIHSVLQKSSNTTMDMENLRQMAFLKHKLALNDLDISLWTTYLLSGTSKLKEDEQELQQAMALTRRNFLYHWPKEVKSTMIADRSLNLDPKKIISHDSCVNYVSKLLHQFREENVLCQILVEEIKQSFNDCFTLEMEEMINHYVEQYGIALHRILTEGKIAIVNYDYNDQLIEQEFHRELLYAPQIKIFNDLAQNKLDKEIATMEVAILKQRLVYNQLPNTFNSLQIPSVVSLETITNAKTRQRLMDRYEKILQRTKSEMMCVYIITEETKMNEYTMKFDTAMAQMKRDQSFAPADKYLTDKMVTILQRRYKNINERIQCLYKLKIRFFDQTEMIQKFDYKNNTSSYIGCSPSVTQHALDYHLSSEQLKFLNRGPTYVSPCQMHLSSSTIILKEILTKQMAPLRHQLTKLFTKYKIDLARRWNFENDIQTQFISSFSLPVPTLLDERALYEKQLIQSIQYQLKYHHLFLRRTADDQNTYYLGSLDEFNDMANQYMENAIWYELHGIINENNTEQQQLKEIMESIDVVLEQLQQKKFITKDHLTKLQIGKKTNLHLPYLYFLPETHQDGHISLQPRLSSCGNSPIQTLATYLDQLLRPLFDKFSRSTTFINGHDFIQKLQHYCLQQDSLLPLTNFLTFKIYNLSIRVSHMDILNALNRFLVNPVNEGRHERLTSETIEELTSLFLRNNLFTYHGKIYRYVKGCPLNFPFTQLLFNIYLHDWQVPLVREIRLADEFYGRYHDIGFLTWNGSMDRVHTCLSALNEQHPDIQITTSVGDHVHFLNVDIENRKGYLYTRVYHDTDKQPFLLPYATGHPRLIHRQWFRFALLRAGQYCSSWEDFNEERLYIELTFLANGYSLNFVEYHLHQFFSRFNPIEKHITLNRWTYSSFRTELFRYLKQQQNNIEQQQQQLASKTHPFIQLSYLFDWGSRCEFNQKFYKLWSTIINQDPTFQIIGFKIKLNSQHCYSSNVHFLQ